MNAAFEKRLGIVWLVLSAITLVQYFGLQSGGAPGIHLHGLLTVSVIGVSLIKVRLILREFMELRHAPTLLARLADTWLVITAAALLGTYFGVPMLGS